MNPNYNPAKALLRRDFIEYRGSFLVTPIVIAAFLAVVSWGGAVFASQFSDWEEGIGWFVANQIPDAKVDIEIRSSEGAEVSSQVGEWVYPSASSAGADQSEWDFAADWTFSAPRLSSGFDDLKDGKEFNQVLNALNVVFLLVMWTISVNYLAGSLYNDRRDRSVLFWRSMPISDRREVFSKYLTVGLAVPLVYAVISIVTQLVIVAAGAFFLARTAAPLEQVSTFSWFSIAEIFRNTALKLPVMIVIVCPLYAWSLVASAWAKNSPVLWMFGLPAGAIFAERWLLGSSWLAERVARCLPGGESYGSMMDMFQATWPEQIAGVVVGVGLLLLAAKIRRYRLEL
ncbi:MAG: hypothetical protein P8O79_02960 [Halieaceae bacterium]|nr:hypothetical protein [Halieaceae bacterium]